MKPTESFTNWWQGIAPTLLRTAIGYGLSRESAYDVVQDVAILALAKLEQEIEFFSQGKEALDRWALARLHWLTIDRFRAKRKHPQESLDNLALLATPANQEEAVLYQEIKAAVRKLPEQQRKVLELSLYGARTRVIAETLRIQESSVRSLLRYARLSLVRLLERK